MTKADLIAQIHKTAEGKLTKADAERVFEQILATFTETLASGEEISFIGFGSFKPSRRPERKGRNPHTGEEITIPAGTTVKFTHGKALKDAMK